MVVTVTSNRFVFTTVTSSAEMSLDLFFVCCAGAFGFWLELSFLQLTLILKVIRVASKVTKVARKRAGGVLLITLLAATAAHFYHAIVTYLEYGHEVALTVGASDALRMPDLAFQLLLNGKLFKCPPRFGDVIQQVALRDPVSYEMMSMTYDHFESECAVVVNYRGSRAAISLRDKFVYDTRALRHLGDGGDALLEIVFATNLSLNAQFAFMKPRRPLHWQFVMLKANIEVFSAAISELVRVKRLPAPYDHCVRRSLRNKLTKIYCAGAACVDKRPNCADVLVKQVALQRSVSLKQSLLRFPAPWFETRIEAAPAQTLAELAMTLTGLVAMYIGLSLIDVGNLAMPLCASGASWQWKLKEFRKIKLHKNN
jgi:hypothetical protein